MSESSADGLLIRRVRSGDLEALGELYERYKTPVYRTALAITRDEALAEDILQETFIRAYLHADKIDDTLPLMPWLYRVTVNLCYTWRSRIKRLWNTLQQTVDYMNSSARHPEAIAEEGEWKQIVQQVLDSLPVDHRTVIVLHYLEGLSLKEIAYITDVPEGTVKSRLHYARERVKKALLERQRSILPEVAYDFT
ncbi:MAG: RNA polymerase sigma factor [Anaerolineae bacterium]|nr:RNA polymerase sigma factor [Anaerolineae bacterium]